MSKRNDYDVDETGIIYSNITTKDIDTILQNKKKQKKKNKQKKRKQKAKLKRKMRIKFESYSTQYYFNKLIDILGTELYSFLNGYSINHLLSTKIRNWGKTIPSICTDSKRWKIYEKDVMDRMRKLLHHYRKLYSYYDRITHKEYKYVGRQQRDPYNTPLLLFAIYDLSDITNSKILRKLNSITLYDLQFDKQNIQRCLYTKLCVYLYLNATQPVRNFEHNISLFRWTRYRSKTQPLLPTADAPAAFVEYEKKVAEQKQAKQYVVKNKDKVVMHEQMQLKMWMENYIRIVDMNEQFKKLRLNIDKDDIMKKRKIKVINRSEQEKKKKAKRVKNIVMELELGWDKDSVVKYYINDGKQETIIRSRRRSRYSQKIQFRLIIIKTWSDIYKYCSEWKRFNKQLREYFCPNILRIRLLYLFLSNDKASLFGWTYNNRVLVFQALRMDVTRN